MTQITHFWKWFQDNEEAIKNAFLIGLNTEEVFSHLNRNFKYISKRIGYIIVPPSENQSKYTIIFTAEGYRKLFPKIIALEERAPQLKYFVPQAFIKPMQEIEHIKNGNDAPRIYENYQIKISQLYMALVNYDISRKQLRIKLFVSNYNYNKRFSDFESELIFIVMEIIGEIAFRKHIKQIEFEELPSNVNGLLPLIDLPDFINYLYKINSRDKVS
ncbi:MAG: hypothetical protein ACI7YS_11175 [Flavobacterium sp.]